MAKCRNCKKEIDAKATRCPYCLTEMPTSEFIVKLKSIIIALAVFSIFALAMYFLIGSIIRNIIVDPGMLVAFSIFIGGFSGIFAIGFLRMYITQEEFRTMRCLIAGILFVSISVALIAVSVTIII